MEENQKLWVIIPCYNASNTIAESIKQIRIASENCEIVVVDDFSSDISKQIISTLNVNLVEHTSNLGVGGAIMSGVKFARENGALQFMTIGADNQRDTADIRQLIEKFQIGKFDLLIGSKRINNTNQIPFLRKVGNWGLNGLFNFLFGTNYTDIASGFRIFNDKVAQNIFSLSKRYSFDTDLRILAFKSGWNVAEIPVFVRYHQYSSQMQSVVLVGLKIAFLMIRRRFS